MVIHWTGKIALLFLIAGLSSGLPQSFAQEQQQESIVINWYGLSTVEKSVLSSGTATKEVRLYGTYKTLASDGQKTSAGMKIFAQSEPYKMSARRLKSLSEKFILPSNFAVQRDVRGSRIYVGIAVSDGPIGNYPNDMFKSADPNAVAGIPIDKLREEPSGVLFEISADGVKATGKVSLLSGSPATRLK